jgi:hypothetical protein
MILPSNTPLGSGAIKLQTSVRHNETKPTISGWLERTAASALFATPPTSTFDEALTYFLACNELVQGKVRYVSICSSNYLLLGQTYEGEQILSF